jgi:D-serine deaminase-like pyridoxal phosphate-dependent protein
MTPRLPLGVDEILSPALLVFAEALDRNLDRMVAIAGGPDRLRPHVKTHKMPAVVHRLQQRGISKAKCATLTEARMLAQCGVSDVLLAMPAVGPIAAALATLAREFPGTRFSTLADHSESVHHVAAAVRRLSVPYPLGVLVDLDNGMHRTGIAVGAEAIELARQIARFDSLAFAGLHVYDGHLRDPDPEARSRAIDGAFEPVLTLRDRIEASGVPVPTIVAGGTPSFSSHARRPGIECSPGTTTLWDVSSETQFGELGFEHAAALLTRVVSCPGGRRVCVDLGHKAVASEMPHPRVFFPELGPVEFVSHSEEHLVFETPLASRLAPGDLLLALPWHICPTVALYDQAVWVGEGRALGCVQIGARHRPPHPFPLLS